MVKIMEVTHRAIVDCTTMPMLDIIGMASIDLFGSHEEFEDLTEEQTACFLGSLLSSWNTVPNKNYHSIKLISTLSKDEYIEAIPLGEDGIMMSYSLGEYGNDKKINVTWSVSQYEDFSK